jgi:predicted nucleic acid-binding protein
VSGSLLDTSILIAAGMNAEALPPTAAISVVSLGELHAGVRLARTRRTGELRRGRLDAVRRAFAALPVDEAVAERYGAALAVARKERRPAKATDLLIIATAAATSRTLHTMDAAQAQLARACSVLVAELGSPGDAPGGISGR